MATEGTPESSFKYGAQSGPLSPVYSRYAALASCRQELQVPLCVYKLLVRELLTTWSQTRHLNAHHKVMYRYPAISLEGHWYTKCTLVPGDRGDKRKPPLCAPDPFSLFAYGRLIWRARLLVCCACFSLRRPCSETYRQLWLCKSRGRALSKTKPNVLCGLVLFGHSLALCVSFFSEAVAGSPHVPARFLSWTYRAPARWR